MTLVVNSPFQAELSTGADLSHAQLGWGQGDSWHCTLKSLLLVLSLAGEKGTTLSVLSQSGRLGERFQSRAESCLEAFLGCRQHVCCPLLSPSPVGGLWGLSVLVTLPFGCFLPLVSPRSWLPGGQVLGTEPSYPLTWKDWTSWTGCWVGGAVEEKRLTEMGPWT